MQTWPGLAVALVLAQLAAMTLAHSTSTPGGVPLSWLRQYEAMLQLREPTTMATDREEDARIMVVLLAPQRAMQSQLYLESLLNKQHYAKQHKHDFKQLGVPCNFTPQAVDVLPADKAACMLLKQQAVKRTLQQHPDKLLWFVNHNTFITNPGIQLQHLLQQSDSPATSIANRQPGYVNSMGSKSGSAVAHLMTGGTGLQQQHLRSVQGSASSHPQTPLVVLPSSRCDDGEVDSFLVQSSHTTQQLWTELVQHMHHSAGSAATAGLLNEYALLQGLLGNQHPAALTTSPSLAGQAAVPHTACPGQPAWTPGTFLGRLASFYSLQAEAGPQTVQQLASEAGSRSRRLASEADTVHAGPEVPLEHKGIDSGLGGSPAEAEPGSQREQQHDSHEHHVRHRKGSLGERSRHRKHGAGKQQHLEEELPAAEVHLRQEIAAVSAVSKLPWEQGISRTERWVPEDVGLYLPGPAASDEDVASSGSSSSDVGTQRASSLSGKQRDWGKYHLAVRVTAPVIAALVVVATAYLPLLYWAWSSQHKRISLLDWRSWVVELEA